jgi:sigma-B regulation protein RsbU (phosphoserine phosphatase)
MKPRLWLALLFLVILSSQATFTIDVIRQLAGDYPETPIYLGDPWPTVVGVGYGDQVHRGDRVLAVEGRTPLGWNDLAQAIRAKHPGEPLHILLDRTGRRQDCSIALRAQTVPLLFTIVWHLLMPWISILLGFWVVAVRPHDVRPWAVLAILAGICQIYTTVQNGWPAPVTVMSTFYLGIAQVAWPAGMLLFGIYFPQPWRLDRRVPWAKWLLLVPIAFIGTWDGVRQAVQQVNYVAGRRIPDLSSGWFLPSLMATAISMFFFALGSKSHDKQAPLTPDDRRRVGLLHGGAQLALTPFSIVFFYSLIVHHRAPQSGTVLGLALMAMIILPVTMAYVIVVERALDVRVVIRQGLQYALARSGIRVIQLAIGFAVIFASIDFPIRWFGDHRISDLARYGFLGLGILLVTRMRDLGDIARRWLDRRFFREAYKAELILGELSEQVRSILDTGELLHTVSRKIAESLHVDRIAVMLRDGAMFRPAFATGYPAPIELSLPSEAPAISHLRDARAPVVPDAEEQSELPGLDARLLLPLASKNDLLGFISLGPKRSEEPYSSDDTRLLLTVAAQTGLALENSRLSEAIAHEVSQRELLNREIEIAREVQQRLFPQNLPHIVSLDYAGHCRPAQGVGGDYYDFLALSDGQLGLAIADISGKGIPAALLMASLQASVRGQSQGTGDVASLMTNVNRLVYEASPANRYATFFYAQFDPRTRRLIWSNGGHNPPILLRGGEVIRLETGGPVVGLFPRSSYEQDAIVLQVGDLLIFYTDGMSEAENPAEEEWGEDALISAARASAEQTPGQTPLEMIASIMNAADAFASGAPQHDDMTLVIARVT